MDTRRHLRGATHADVTGIVALLRLHDAVPSWRAEVVVERILAGPSIALVIDDPLLEGIAAVLLARPVGGGSEHWSVDALAVRQQRDAATIIPALLSAGADRLFRSGVDTLVVPLDPSDQRWAKVLHGAGLRITSWLLWRPSLPDHCPTPDDYEPGLTLPHLHGLRPHGPATPTRVESAGAMVARATLPFGCAASLEVVDLFDPVVATDAASLTDLMCTPSPSRNGRADSAVAVALGPGEESLDTALCSLGFRPLLDWWCLHLVG